MKNLKKILALAVAFVMCFTMFAGAATFTDVQMGGDYSQAITFLSDLQVIAGKPDGSFGINDAITRADAACLIARLMTGKQNPDKYDGHVAFTDVPAGSYYETSVGYCAALGITVGKGNGRFAPEDTITDGEFIAMLTRALGYDTAEHPLAFPMGNITTAAARGLLDGVDAQYASDALRGEDAQMLYNALFAEYDRAAANKNLYQGSDDHWDVTIAEEVFGLGRLSHDIDADTDNSHIGKGNGEVSFHGANRNNNPAVDCDAHTWVIAGVDARNKENTYIAFAIDDDDVKAISPEEKDKEWAYQEFTYSGDIKPLLGYRVELWGEYDHSNPVWDVAAIKVVDGSHSDSRASTSAFQSRYSANQSTYKYTPDMYTDSDKVVIDDKTLYINKNNVCDTAKINLDINTTGIWMWKTETELLNNDTTPAVPAAYKDFDNTNAANGAYTNRAEAYRLAGVTASLARNPLSNRQVNLNFADGDQYTLIDWDSDDYIDFVVVDTAKYAEVKSKTASRMVLEAADRSINATTGARSSGEYSLKLDDDNLKVEGADSIEEGDVVEITVVSRVYDRKDGEVVTIKVAKVDPEAQKLEKINLTKDTYTLDGEERTFADPDLFDLVEEADSRDDLRIVDNIGKTFNIWYDRNGFMLKAEISDDSASGYLMVLETADGQSNLHTTWSTARRDYAVMDVLFDDNTVGESVEVVKDLRIDGSSTANGYDSATRTWNEKLVVGNVYRYIMNDDGRITRLESQVDPRVDSDNVQVSDYNYDESKVRLGTHELNGFGEDVQKNYTFTDDAVVFAVKRVGSDANGRDALDNGYLAPNVMDSYIRHTNIAGKGDHFFVDPADVMAVSIDDVPEIDNRMNNGNFTSSPWEKTHPATFIAPKGSAVGDFAANWFAWTDAEFTASPAVANPGVIPANKWMRQLVGWHNDPALVDNNVNQKFNYDTGSDVGYVAPPAQQTPGVYPAAAFTTNRDGDIPVALLGVDSLDFFGSSSVKLGLITDISAIGSKTYEVRIAMDGKYEWVKTIADDEANLFKGRLNGENLSYQTMLTYLDLNENTNAFGSGNGMYAEVLTNKDGLITEIRAMSLVQPSALAATTYWGNDVVQANFWEGNVYRVIRGVTTQLLSKNGVTWQASPTAASSDTLYSMDPNADNNGYDNLQASYDENTNFYYIDQLPRLIADRRAFIDFGFKSNVDEKLQGKGNDSSVLNASTFNSTDGGSDFYICDYAVYKNDMDRLAGVWAFDNCDNSKGGDLKTRLELTGRNGADGKITKNQTVEIRVPKTKSESGDAGDKTTELTIVFTRVVDATGLATTHTITFNGQNNDAEKTLKNLDDRLNWTVGDPATIDGEGDLTGMFASTSLVNRVLTVTANPGETLSFELGSNFEDTEYEMTFTEIPASTVAQPTGTLTVRNSTYTIPTTSFVISTDIGALKNGVTITLPAGTYSSVRIAQEIARQLNVIANITATVGDENDDFGNSGTGGGQIGVHVGNTVGIVDGTLGLVGDLNINITDISPVDGVIFNFVVPTP